MRNCEHCAKPLVPDNQMQLDPDLCQFCAKTFWETLAAEIAKWPKLEESPVDDPPPVF